MKRLFLILILAVTFTVTSTLNAEMAYKKRKDKGQVMLSKDEGTVKITVTKYDSFGDIFVQEEEINVAWYIAHRGNLIEQIAKIQAQIDEIDALLADVDNL